LPLFFPVKLPIYQLHLKYGVVSISYVSSPKRKPLSVSNTPAFLVKRMKTFFYASKFSQNIFKTCQESVKSNEAISYAEISSKVCSGVLIDDGNKKMAKEIKG
jgi:hypothetical protein